MAKKTTDVKIGMDAIENNNYDFMGGFSSIINGGKAEKKHKSGKNHSCNDDFF